MSAPQLNRLLVLEQAARVPDGAGGFTSVWSAVCSHWAEVRAGAGRQLAGEEVIAAQVAYQITLRGVPFGDAARPRPEQRLREGARIFTILAVAERDAEGRYLMCFAREEVPA